MNSPYKRHSSIVQAENTALLVIDIQDKVIRVVQDPESVIQNAVKLIEGFKILGLPVFATEQYPKGLGETEASIKNSLGDNLPFQKMSFSCIGAGNLFEILHYRKIKQVVIAGIEAHVCVQQTALDLLANGFQVFLAANACSSRKGDDYKFALERMRAKGVIVTTTEAVLFEILKISGTEDFKHISKLIK